MELRPYDIALQLAGEKEIVGKNDNPRITAMFDAVGFEKHNFSDEISWCAAMVGYCLKEAGYSYMETLSATAYLDYGKAVVEPRLGDLVIFWRGEFKGQLIPGTDVMKGHVAFYLNDRWGWVRTIDGNWGNQLWFNKHPEHKVLGYRRPVKQYV